MPLISPLIESRQSLDRAVDQVKYDIRHQFGAVKLIRFLYSIAR
jgi:hypothetical protein